MYCVRSADVNYTITIRLGIYGVDYAARSIEQQPGRVPRLYGMKISSRQY